MTDPELWVNVSEFDQFPVTYMVAGAEKIPPVIEKSPYIERGLASVASRVSVASVKPTVRC